MAWSTSARFTPLGSATGRGYHSDGVLLPGGHRPAVDFAAAARLPELLLLLYGMMLLGLVGISGRILVAMTLGGGVRGGNLGLSVSGAVC